MTKLGFTGTRRGMNLNQKRVFRWYLEGLIALDEFHHGDCRGADEEAHAMVRVAFPQCVIHIHPAEGSTVWRAWCNGDFYHPEKPPLARNRDIVDNVHQLAAAPRTREEQLRSGTWTTIRYARKVCVPIFMLRP